MIISYLLPVNNFACLKICPRLKEKYTDDVNRNYTSLYELTFLGYGGIQPT